MGALATIISVGGLVGFATVASAHDNYVTSSGACDSGDSGAVVTWTISNDYNLTESGTASATGGGTLSPTSFSIGPTGSYPSPPVATATLTQTLTPTQLADDLGSVSTQTITLNWSATWSDHFSTSGTGTFDLATLPNGCKGSPTLATSATPTSEAVGGGALADSATLTGGKDPTGTIIFYLFNPDQTCSAWPSEGSYAFSEAFTANGDQVYGPTTGGPNPSITGTWHWLAVYSGDANNTGTNSGCATEPVTVTNSLLSVSTSAAPTSEAVGGIALADSATLSGGSAPTGTITFYLFNPDQTCSAWPTQGNDAFSEAFSVTGDKTYGPTTGGPDPNVTGTWHWLAVYSGDGNNPGTNSGCTSEPVTVTKAAPSVNTWAAPPSETVGGEPVNDTASLSGGYNPTGTISFFLFSPSQTCSAWPSSGTYTFEDQVTVSGDGSYDSTGGPVPTVAGTWQWVAVYSGDGDNTPADSGCGSEPVTVGRSSPGLTTSTNPTSETVGGSHLDDSATLSGGDNPTGTITFYLFNPDQSCSVSPTSGSYTFKDSVSVSGDGTYTTTGGPVPILAGTWRWVAVYGGDTNNGTADSGCWSEPVSVSKMTPSVTTAAKPTTETVGGAGLNDTGTISGGYNPTGTITFYIFNPDQTCSAWPTGGSYTFEYSVKVSGDGTYATTGGPEPILAGTWQWVAVYSGDADNNAADSGCSTEPVIVNQASPSLVTSAHPTSETVGGPRLNDSATISNGFDPTGTITFYLFDPDQTCSTSPASGTYTFKDSVTAAGDGTYETTGGPVPTLAGTWQWVAVYGGDSDNGTANSGCGTEPVTVNQAPTTMSTQQSASPSGLGSVVIGTVVTDTATVASPFGTPDGSVSFTICGPTPSVHPCRDGDAVGTVPVPLVDGHATSVGFTPSAVGTYCFGALYKPGLNYLTSSDNTDEDNASSAECFAATTPNFTVLKTNVPGDGKPVGPGSTIPYTITIENVGNATGSATITDDVPSNLTVQGTPSCAVTGSDTCTVANPSGSTWTFTVSLASGDVGTATFNATLSATDTADVVNTATITTGICDTGGTNTTQGGQHPVAVQCTSTVTNPVPDFTVTKSDVPSSGTSAPPGSTIDYTVVIRNVGDGAGSAVVTDVLPSSLSVKGTPGCAITPPDACAVANPSGSTWTFTVSLAPGHTATATFATAVATSATGTIANTATITTGPCNTSSGCSATVNNPVVPVITMQQTVPTAPPPAPLQTTPVPTPLAFTGALMEQEWILGLGAAALGAALVGLARRRRRPVRATD